MESERRVGYSELASDLKALAERLLEMRDSQTKMQGQIERLVADAESEKDTRSKVNSDLFLRLDRFDTAYHANDGVMIRLERFDQFRRTAMSIFRWLGGIIAALIVAVALQYLRLLGPRP